MTQNNIDSNIPIEVSKGGTNATSMANTDGVCYFDGTSLVTTTVGTAGQVLTSNGAAVAPTFQISPVFVVKTKLTSAQIKTLHTPIALIAAQGANTLIVPQLATAYFFYGGSNVFASINGYVDLVYQTSNRTALSSSHLLTNAQMVGTASLFTQVTNTSGTGAVIPVADAINKALNIYNPQNSFTGNAAADNYIILSVYYVVATMI